MKYTFLLLVLIAANKLFAQQLYKPFKGANYRYGYRLKAASDTDSAAVVVPAVYNKVFTTWIIGDAECAKVAVDTAVGLVGMNGKILLPPIYDDIVRADDMDDIAMVARKGDKFWFVGYKFQLLNEVPYTIAGAGLANSLLSIDDQNLYRLEGLIYEDKRNFYFDFLPIAKGDSFGVINRKARPTINFKYQSALWASKELNYFAVKQNELWGIVDEKGKTVLPMEYDEYYYALTQTGDQRLFKKGGRYVYIDILDTSEDTIGYLDTTNYAFTIFFHNGKQGVLRSDLVEIVPFEYERVLLQEDFLLFRAIRDNKLGFYNRDGTLIIPVEYDTEWTLEGGDYILDAFDPKKGIINLTKNGQRFRFDATGRKL